MVIWGDYEYTGDSIQVDTRFAFVRPDGQSGGTGLQAFSSIANIRAGRMDKSIDDVVFSLCALMAISERRLPPAKKWLEKVTVKDARHTRFLEKLNAMQETIQDRNGPIRKRPESEKQPQ